MSEHYPSRHPDASAVAIDHWFDERGFRCPIPVVTLAKARRLYGDDITVAVVADDQGAENDIPAWCRIKGAEFLGVRPPKDSHPGWAYVVHLPADQNAGSQDNAAGN